MAKPKISTRERKALELLSENKNKSDIANIALELNNTLEEISFLQDHLFFKAVKETSITEEELQTSLNNTREELNRMKKLINNFENSRKPKPKQKKNKEKIILKKNAGSGRIGFNQSRI